MSAFTAMAYPTRPRIVSYLMQFPNGLLRLLPALILVTAADNLVSRQLSRRIAALALAVIVGTAVGYWLGRGYEFTLYSLRLHPQFTYHSPVWDPLIAFLAQWFDLSVLAGLATAIYFFHTRDLEVAEALHQEAIDAVGLDKQMTEARLQVMQAQIEPHFLFNTLATVRRLYQTDPASGRATLRHLSRYLSAALPKMRDAGATLDQELELTAAYLQVQEMRMGRRLSFEFDVPNTLKSLNVPPMMLATLAENAVKHGLGPLPEGGSLRISARTADGRLHLEVSDTGQGFQASSGTGVGLANIRARLAALYGGAAQLVIAQNTPRGVRAIIELPCTMGAPA